MFSIQEQFTISLCVEDATLSLNMSLDYRTSLKFLKIPNSKDLLVGKR